MSSAVSTATSQEPEANSEATEMDFDLTHARASAMAAVISQGSASWGRGLETQIALLSYMRARPSFQIEPESTHALNLVWRLMIVTGLAAAVATLGFVLTVVAFIGGALSPNPFVALSVLCIGAVLLATVVKIVRGGGDSV